MLAFVIGSVEGFLGVFGFLLGLIVVPIYLFFFLRDAAMISRRWSDYLPLRNSEFKNEVVSCLTEINRYLIAFFRGQILVTMIDGAILGLVLLWPINLQFRAADRADGGDPATDPVHGNPDLLDPGGADRDSRNSGTGSIR